MKFTSVIVAACAAGAALSADAALVAAWNFNQGLTSGSQSAQTLAANHGIGTMTTNWNASNFLVFTPTGTSAHNGLNAVAGDLDGNDLGLQNGTVANGTVLNAGRHLQFQINTLGVQDLVLSLAARRTATGMNTQSVSWATDGVNFTTVGAFTPAFNASAYTLATFDLSAVNAIENLSAAYIRITFTDPVPGSNGSLSSGGNVRIDNLQFNGTLIPTPGSLALLGLASLAARRRR
jgi:hypothetical protein